MFEANSIEVGYDDIVRVVSQNEHVLVRLEDKITVHNVEQVVADVQICAFLTRVRKSGFRFVHRSFMEFFLARYVKGLMEGNKADAILDQTLPYEVLYCLGGYALFEGRFLVKAEYRLRNESHKRGAEFRRNLVRIQLYSGEQFSRRKFARVDITEMAFKGMIFVDVELEEIAFRNCEFRRWSWEGVSAQAVTLADVKIRDWDCSFIRGELCVRGCSVRNWRCEGKGVDYDVEGLVRGETSFRVEASGFDIQEAAFEGAELSLNGDLKVSAGKVVGSTLTLEAGSAQKIDLGAVRFKASRVVCRRIQRPSQIDVSKVSFERCELYNLPVTYNVLAGMKDSRRLEGCSGILLVFGVPAEDRRFIVKSRTAGRRLKNVIGA